MLRSIYLFLLKYIYIDHLEKKDQRFTASKRERLDSGGKITPDMEGEIDEQRIDESVLKRYREYLTEKNTIRELWTSIIYTVDVVYDWIFVEELYQHWQQKEPNLRYLFIPSLIFAILGTILYLLDAFDVFQWLNLCSSGKAWKVTFCNFMLEDLPQMVITGIAAVYERQNDGEEDIFTTTIILNLFTSSFALITKCVAIQESRENQEEEYTFPNLHSFVKKNKKLAEILVKEDLKIFPCQLDRLINDIEKEKQKETKEIPVRTDMPGGVIAVLQSFEKTKPAYVDKNTMTEICVKFENKSRMNTQEVSHLVVEMNELWDVTYKLDLRQCCIGTNTPKVVSEFNIKRIVYEPSTFFGLQLLLRQTARLLIKEEGKDINIKKEHEIQVFPDNVEDVWLKDIVLDEFVIKGLCHVLKSATHVRTLRITNYYNNGITTEDAAKQFETIKEEIEKKKHITRFYYEYDKQDVRLSGAQIYPYSPRTFGWQYFGIGIEENQRKIDVDMYDSFDREYERKEKRKKIKIS